MADTARVAAWIAAQPAEQRDALAAISRGVDVLVADHMDPDSAMALLIAVARNGEDVDAFVAHMVTLRAAFNDRDRPAGDQP